MGIGSAEAGVVVAGSQRVGMRMQVVADKEGRRNGEQEREQDEELLFHRDVLSDGLMHVRQV